MFRLVTCFLALFGAGLILGISALSQAQPRQLLVMAQELTATASDSSLLLPSPSPSNYYLAYPGILPDHPLYWLKMMRDRVRLILTRDPLQRSRLMLLYADKRIGAAQALAQGNKLGLAVSTATKAEDYLLQSSKELVQLDTNQEGVRDQWETMGRAVLKHREILVGLLMVSPDEAKQVVEQAQGSNSQAEEQVRRVGGVELETLFDASKNSNASGSLAPFDKSTESANERM